MAFTSSHDEFDKRAREEGDHGRDVAIKSQFQHRGHLGEEVDVLWKHIRYSEENLFRQRPGGA